MLSRIKLAPDVYPHRQTSGHCCCTRMSPYRPIHRLNDIIWFWRKGRYCIVSRAALTWLPLPRRDVSVRTIHDVQRERGRIACLLSPTFALVTCTYGVAYIPGSIAEDAGVHRSVTMHASYYGRLPLAGCLSPSLCIARKSEHAPHPGRTLRSCTYHLSHICQPV